MLITQLSYASNSPDALLGNHTSCHVHRYSWDTFVIMWTLILEEDIQYFPQHFKIYISDLKLFPPVLPRFIGPSRSTRNLSYWGWRRLRTSRLPGRERCEGRFWHSRCFSAGTPRTNRVQRGSGSSRTPRTSRILLGSTELCGRRARTPRSPGRERVRRRDWTER